MIAGKAYYDRLPVWAQGVAVSLASARNLPRKYGRDFHGFLAELTENERRTRDQLIEMQQARLKALLRHAVTHVPYYRDLNLSPDSIADWPTIDKQTVAAAPDRFVSDLHAAHDLMTVRTSGTTGTPLTVRFTGASYRMEMAFRWKHRAWAGVHYPSRSAYVAGHPVVPADARRPPFWRKDLVEKRLLCSSYHLTSANLPGYLHAIASYRPAFVHGYPSSLYLLAQAALKHGIDSVRPRAVFTASETLLDFQREAIERAFCARLFNWYGNSEMTCNIVECAAGNLHYRTDYGLLEVLDDGTMVCTALNNPAMPLIRYRVGDRIRVGNIAPGDSSGRLRDVATLTDSVCSCGCAFPLVDSIEGRLEDYVRTPDGRFVGRLDHLFKDVEHVQEAQIVQDELAEVVLRIVRTNGYGAGDEQTILTEARQRLGSGMKIRFEYTDSIERTASGKFRFIVSRLQPRMLGHT